MSTQAEKIAQLRAEAARVRDDRSPFGLSSVALSPDTLDALLDDLEAAGERIGELEQTIVMATAMCARPMGICLPRPLDFGEASA